MRPIRPFRFAQLILLIAAFVGLFCPERYSAQTVFPPAIEWQRSFGGTNDDRLRTLAQTPDGGFVLGGFSNSGSAGGANGNKTSPGFGDYDGWVVRLDGAGNHVWDRSFGGTNEDVFYRVLVVPDGGFLVGGYTASGATGNKTSANLGGYDFWVLRLDAGGTRLWEAAFGGISDDYLRDISPVVEGGWILGGQSLSPPGGNKTADLIGTNDFWVVRIDANGNRLWDRSFGGTGADRLQSLRQTADGGFILGGVSLSGVSGNKTGANYGLNDFWLVRLDGNGNKLWDRSFGGTDNDELLSVQETFDGGFILGGFSWSGAGGNKTSRNYGDSDFWVIRVDSAGNKLWEQSFGGRDADSVRSLQQTRDGGFVLGGISASGTTGTKTSPYFGGTADFWVVRLDEGGSKLWELSLGGMDDDGIWSLQQTADGGFLVGGGSASLPGGNKSSARFGSYDYWVVKLQPDAARLRVPPQTAGEIRQAGLQLFLAGISNNFYRTEYTTNLTDWLPLQTNRITAAETAIVDRGATNAPRRYYRSQLWP
jgi:hypothetical protein